MSYAQMVDWMFNLERFGIKLGLDNMREFSHRIGDPHLDFRSVHVTGTNGKGSVCTFVSEMLRRHGLKVGLYTSPHLVDFRERIRVDGRMIPQRDVVRLGEELRVQMEDMASHGKEKQLTFFEFTTGLAFQYFKEKGVDFVVAEVGMGGRLDATNIILPDVAAITRIGLEHTDYLGKTIMEIAGEKAGIIKGGCDVVTCEKDPAVLGLFQQACDRGGCRLARFGRDFGVSCVSQSLSGTRFDYRGLREIPGLRTGLLGAYQAENAALAVAAVERLAAKGVQVTDEEVRAGLKGARWPGRLDVVSRKPMLMFDGSHNPDGALTTARTLEAFGMTPLTFVLGCMKDKDAREIVRALAPRAAMFVVTQVDNKRAMGAEELGAVVRQEYAGPVSVVLRSGDAIEKALAEFRGEGVCAIGSLYLVGEAIQWRRARQKADNKAAHKV
ncbi:MAG: folylpolyglutamate synthase/dihydrofolate synthase family protein [Candidatus Thermoplasmatota archaeon]